MDWTLMIAAIIQAHHADAAAAEANRVAAQELESVTKRELKLHFASSAELKSGVDWKNVVDGDKLIVVMPGDVKPIFTGERALGSDIKLKADKDY